MAPVEYGTERLYRRGTFPESWGPPPYNEELRHRWILAHCRDEIRARPYRQLEQAAIRYQNLARQAQLLARWPGA